METNLLLAHWIVFKEMTELKLQLLGELSVVRDGATVKLPASRKTRALLAYLVRTARPQRRERLCELLWEVPDDPRGALRWSLSKLRPIVNTQDRIRLQADRERVWFNNPELVTDTGLAERDLNNEHTPLERLIQIERALSEPFLDGLELARHDGYQGWLEAERTEMRRLRGRICGRIAEHASVSADVALDHYRKWQELDPFNPVAASGLLAALNRLGRSEEAAPLQLEFQTRFERAGIDWPSPIETHNTLSQASKLAEPRATHRQLLERQRINFCTANDGVKIAYARVGTGSPLVKAANWLNHLELDWDAPIWSPLFRELATEHTFIRYDERGNGLSDWDVPEISFESFVTDLETVVEATGLERFPLLGISQGASVSIEYAIRHPSRVSHLILFGAYDAGWRIDTDEQIIKEREAIMTLTASGWGQDNPAYRQIFSSTFMPSATSDELSWFDEFQRRTTSSDNAVRFLSAFGDIDVRHRLSELNVPTLVLHSRGDQRIPFETGREIAAKIRGAEFIGLESDNHLLLGREPASAQFIRAVREFLAS